jgi:hypothetical protein
VQLTRSTCKSNKKNMVRMGNLHTRSQLAIDMCESAVVCCLPARCSQSRWGPCCVRAAIRLHTTTHVAFRGSSVQDDHL